MLRDLHLQEEYFTGDTDLVETFYQPCLFEAIEYNRSVGYFRSSVFILIGPRCNQLCETRWKDTLGMFPIPDRRRH